MEISPLESMSSEAFWSVESVLEETLPEQLPIYKGLPTRDSRQYNFGQLTTSI